VGIGAGLLLGATGGAGLVVVAASDLGDRVQHIMKRASKVTSKQLQADEAAVDRDIEAAAAGPDQDGP
jgi:hypothetical protein